MTTITAVRATAPPAAPPLDFDEKLALAPLTISDTPLNLADVIRNAPIDVAPPVTSLLLRAQARVLAPGGWGHGASNCLESAIQLEARSGRDEQEARNLIRRAAGSGDPLPHINLQLASASQAGQLLGAAARLAEKAGL